MLTVTKRDGTRVPFDLTKIEDAVERAFNAEHQEINKDILELLALRVTADFNKKIKDDSVSVEDIQDSVGHIQSALLPPGGLSQDTCGFHLGEEFHRSGRGYSAFVRNIL